MHRNRWWVPVAVGLFIGSACGDNPSWGCECILDYQAVASGQYVATHKNPADTAARAMVAIHGSGTSFSFTYSLAVAPHGTVNGIRILQGTVIKGTICSAAPCARSGIVIGVTDSTLNRIMRNVAATVRVYTDSDPAGAADGAITPVSP
ncbi:MAG TPA: hypothetical protein VLV16_07110 [Gemmatimonadales bacterium]|nr:hypothetical protein [Gemmatimonadales bacterium]